MFFDIINYSVSVFCSFLDVISQCVDLCLFHLQKSQAAFLFIVFHFVALVLTVAACTKKIEEKPPEYKQPKQKFAAEKKCGIPEVKKEKNKYDANKSKKDKNNVPAEQLVKVEKKDDTKIKESEAKKKVGDKDKTATKEKKEQKDEEDDELAGYENCDTIDSMVLDQIAKDAPSGPKPHATTPPPAKKKK